MPIQLIAFMAAVFSLACFAAAIRVFITAFSVEGSPVRKFLVMLGGFVVCCILWYHGELAGTYAGNLYGKMILEWGK